MASKLAQLKQEVNEYRDMMARSDDFEECDRLLEIIAEYERQIAKLEAEAAPVARKQEGKTMASKGFKLTDNQKHVAELLYNFGNLTEGYTGERVMPSRVSELIKKGIFEKTNGDSPINYWELRFTVEGQEWADTEFGDTPTSTPDNTPTSDSGEAVQPESKYDDETRIRTYKAIRSFYKNAHGNLAEFYSEFGTDTFGLSDEAIAEWRQMDADDAHLEEQSRRLMEEKESAPSVFSEPISNSAIPVFEPTDEPACDWCKGTENVSTRYYRGAPVLQVCEVCMPSADTVDSVYGGNLWSEDAFDDLCDYSEAMWQSGIMPATTYTRSNSTGQTVCGHGRKSRKRTKTGIPANQVVEDLNRAKNAGTRQIGAKKPIVATMERNTDAAKQWRNKRALANAVAVPVPAITGHELMQAGQQLTMLPRKRRKLGRVA